MSTQLQLLNVPATPTLTARQERALELVTQAGPDGIHADEIGAQLHEDRPGKWQHSRDQRCPFCGSTGKEVLGALKHKGLVRYMRGTSHVPGRWLATGLKTPQPHGMTDRIPF